MVSLGYDAANEQTQFGTASLTFDANGNLTSDGTNTYTWDARNRLTGISGGMTASFSYDALGRRISKTINGVMTSFVYDGNDIAQELSGGAVRATYLRSLNIDEPFIRQASSDEFYHTDALGSTVVLSNVSGAPATTYSYEAFGNTTSTGTSVNPFQFTGRENDGTGLYYYRARYYAPTSQRFVQEDPLGFDSGELNFYSYVFSSPTNYTDPAGTIVILSVLLNCAANFLTDISIDVVLDKKPDFVSALSGCVPGIGQLARVVRIAKKLPSLDELSRAASIADRGGLTKAGRALQKKAGRNVVDEILTAPGSQSITRQTGRFGEVIEVRAPDGRGVRYDQKGNFIGFLEP